MAATKKTVLTDAQIAALTQVKESYGLTGKRHISGTHPSVKEAGMTPERVISYLATSSRISSFYAMGHGKGSKDIVKGEGIVPSLPSCRKVLEARGWTAEQAAIALLLVADHGGNLDAPMCKALGELTGSRPAPKAKAPRKAKASKAAAPAPEADAPAPQEEVTAAA